MARPKGGKNKRWSTEEKLRIVRRYFDEELVKGHLQKKRISVQDNCITGSKDMLKVALKQWKTGKNPAILLRQFIRVRLSLKNNG